MGKKCQKGQKELLSYPLSTRRQQHRRIDGMHKLGRGGDVFFFFFQADAKRLRLLGTQAGTFSHRGEGGMSANHMSECQQRLQQKKRPVGRRKLG